MPILKDKLFTLRPFRKGDEVSLARNINDKMIARKTLLIPHPYTLEDAKQWIKKNLNEAKKRKRQRISFVIDIDGEVAGSLGFNKIEDHKAELGYWLARKYWNKGIMTRAVKIFSKFGFRALGLKRIYAFAFPFNNASIRVLEKSGFIYEGLLRKHSKKGKTFLDGVLYAKVI
ncbi:MAG: GNAT family N-acetyltransferase [Minisyncoccia bacterium]|jgi:RimJ/RimL family protein N-acetyltransferase